MAKRGGRRGGGKMRSSKSMKRQSYNRKRKPPRKNAQQRKKRRKDENSEVDAESKDTIQQQRDRKGKKVEPEQSENKPEGGQSLATNQEIQKALEESNATGPTTKENPRHNNCDNLEKAKKGLVKRKEKQPRSANKSETKVSTDKKSSKKKTNKSKNGQRRNSRRGEETPVSKGSESKRSNSDGSESMNQTSTSKEQQQ